jgi:hypothetical protein
VIGVKIIREHGWFDITPTVVDPVVNNFLEAIIEATEIVTSSNDTLWQQCFYVKEKRDDVSPTMGGSILPTTTATTVSTREQQQQSPQPPRKKKKQRTLHHNDERSTTKFEVQYGGPEVLALASNQHRTLFLCYPDENDGKRTTTTTTDDDDTTDHHPVDVNHEEEDDDGVVAVVANASSSPTTTTNRIPWRRNV